MSLAVGVALAAVLAQGPVVLEVEPCVDVQPFELRRLLSIELGRPVSLFDGSEVGLRARADCVGASVRLRIIDGRAHERASRVLRLPPTGGERLLSLALAELLESGDPGVVEPAPAPAPDAAPSPPSAQPSLRTIALGAGVTSFVFRAPAFAWVTNVEGMARVYESLVLGVGLSLQGTEALTTLGLTSLLAASAALTAQWLIHLSRVVIAAGLGARVGVAVLNGHPTTADVRGASLVRPWGGPLVVGTGMIWLTSKLGLLMGTEAGWAVGGVNGLVEGVTTVGLGGLWLTARTGLVLSW